MEHTQVVVQDGGRAVPHLTSAKPWLSAGLQLPLWAWKQVFMGFAMVLVEGFCCLVGFLRSNHYLHALTHSLSITHDVDMSSHAPTEGLQRGSILA